MLLADSSVWIAHFRGTLKALEPLLMTGDITCHPVIIGELACGNLTRRTETLAFLDALPSAATASDAECRDLIERHRLHGRGVGWTDVQLLAAARLSRLQLWTLDTRLHAEAKRLGLAFLP
jgi:predicted nucleic acid-binding protein